VTTWAGLTVVNPAGGFFFFLIYQLLIKVGSQQYMITYKLSALSRKKAHTKMVDPAN
jgi:hypothetical protein